MSVRPKTVKRPNRTWIVWLLFLGSIFLFWVLPSILGPRPLKVEFETRAAK